MKKRPAIAQDSLSSAKRVKKFFVTIERQPEVQKARLELPVCMHEQEIIEAIHEHDVVLITGATGTGKTTQVPQFLVEDGFGHSHSPHSRGLIAVTQPRRVAAISCAKRVAFEMNANIGGLVGYQIRHEVKMSSETRVKFGTDGVFLREVEHDILLSKYSAIIIDEVHERSMNTDLLLAFLSRTVIMRRQEKKHNLGRLKVIIMSATLDIEGVFAGDNALFPNPAVVKVPSRQHPITIHFAKKTVEDYVHEAFRKVSKIHHRLPPGGILVFLSGREEVEQLCNKLRERFSHRKVKVKGCDDIELTMTILPFYALLPEHLQRHVFATHKETTTRKVVIATNIAETSVTVPAISYVVDSGRVKEKTYKGVGCGRVHTFEIGWVSRASAEQRAGRAGRTGPGHCYRLFSSAVYDQRMAAFRTPEILRVPADAVVLRLRAMGIRHIVRFPFATPPRREDLVAAEGLLTRLGALRDGGGGGGVLLGVTKIGREIARLPVEPRLARMIVSARRWGGTHDGNGEDVVGCACRLAGVLSVGTVLLRDGDARARRASLKCSRSELLTEVAAVSAVEYAELHSGNRDGADRRRQALCERLGLHPRAVREAVAVGRQVVGAVGVVKGVGIGLRGGGNEVVEGVLRAVVAGFADRVARRVGVAEAAGLGVAPRVARRAFKVAGREGVVFLRGGSEVEIGRGVEFVCFAELEEVVVRRRKGKVGKDEDEDEGEDDYEESGDEDEEGEDDVGVIGNREGKNGRKERRRKEEEEEEEEEERRVVMRGVSVVDGRWIMEEAEGMCEWEVVGEEEVGYDCERGWVTEVVRVRYGVEGWVVGRRRVTVAEAEGKVVGDGVRVRRGRQCLAFARALVEGRVRGCERLRDDGGGGREVLVRGVGGVMERLGVMSEVGLRGVVEGEEVVEEVGRMVEGCCRGERAVEVGRRWREVLRALRGDGGGKVAEGRGSGTVEVVGVLSDGEDGGGGGE